MSCDEDVAVDVLPPEEEMALRQEVEALREELHLGRHAAQAPAPGQLLPWLLLVVQWAAE